VGKKVRTSKKRGGLALGAKLIGKRGSTWALLVFEGEGCMHLRVSDLPEFAIRA